MLRFLKYFSPIFILSLLLFRPAAAQSVTLADYQRAQSFLWENINNQKVFNLGLHSGFFPDSSGLWYVDHSPERKDFYRLDFDEFEAQPLFDAPRLADSLTILFADEISSQELPFDRINVLSGDTLAFTIRGKDCYLDLSSYRVGFRENSRRNNNRMESTSPDGKWTAITRDYNLFVRSTETGEEYQLSTDGEKNFEYGTYYGWDDLMEGENGPRPERFSVSWSPDSRYLRANLCDLRHAEKMYLLDYSVDTLYRPRLLSYYRGSPGDTTIVHLSPVFYEMDSRKEVLRLERRGSIAGYRFWWLENSPEVLVIDRERGYQKLTYERIDLANGQRTVLFSETSETNIVESADVELFEAFDKFVFLSERSGWQHFYSFDLGTGKITPLTSGDYLVHRIVRTDPKNGWIYFIASGKEAGDNPYYHYLYRVSIREGEVQCLTPEAGHHEIDFSPDGRYFIDEYSSYQEPARFRLRSAQTGEVLADILETDISGLLAMGWSPPEAFTATARDGKTIIYGAIWKPTNFDPAKKYPIIDHSYTGPHTQVFPRRFEQVLYSGLQDIAELGFIVVRIDGMGTYGRSKAFHDVSYKNMGQNLLDHVLAIRQLGERFTWADSSRVGIFGHSAGGFDAGHAVLEYPDFYKVAVASSADHDFRMEKAWWPEMYMGWPVDSSYHLVSNITMAGNLKGKLLITHGGLDDNVNPSATFKLAEALIRADKEFDMLILPSQRHGYGGQHSNYFRKKRWNYFVEHLLGASPIWNIEQPVAEKRQ